MLHYNHMKYIYLVLGRPDQLKDRLSEKLKEASAELKNPCGKEINESCAEKVCCNQGSSESEMSEIFENQDIEQKGSFELPTSATDVAKREYVDFFERHLPDTVDSRVIFFKDTSYVKANAVFSDGTPIQTVEVLSSLTGISTDKGIRFDIDTYVYDHKENNVGKIARILNNNGLDELLLTNNSDGSDLKLTSTDQVYPVACVEAFDGDSVPLFTEAVLVDVSTMRAEVITILPEFKKEEGVVLVSKEWFGKGENREYLLGSISSLNQTREKISELQSRHSEFFDATVSEMRKLEDSLSNNPLISGGWA